MAVALLPHEPRHNDALPPVLAAGANAGPPGAVEALSPVIAQLFVKHGVHNDFGVILLHNHFDLALSEILVQLGNAAVPWDTLNNSADPGDVLPSAWRFVDGGLAPYELVYKNPRDTAAAKVTTLTPGQHGSFLSDLRDTLSDLGLTDVLGLCLLENKDVESPAAAEIESGRPTITVDVDVNPQQNGTFIHVIWQCGTRAGTDLRLYSSTHLVNPPEASPRLEETYHLHHVWSLVGIRG